MKISRIACVALFSASIITGAFASAEVDAYEKALTQTKASAEALNKVEKALDLLKSAGAKKVKDWDSTKATNAELYKAFTDIKDAIVAAQRVFQDGYIDPVAGPDSTKGNEKILTLTAKTVTADKIVVYSNGDIKVTFTGGRADTKIEADLTNLETVLNNMLKDDANVKSVTEILEAFKAKKQELAKEFNDHVNEKALAITAEADKSEYYDAIVKARNDVLKDDKKALDDAIKAANDVTSKKDDTFLTQTNVKLKSKDAVAILNQYKDIERIHEALTDANINKDKLPLDKKIAILKEALAAGVFDTTNNFTNEKIDEEIKGGVAKVDTLITRALVALADAKNQIISADQTIQGMVGANTKLEKTDKEPLTNFLTNEIAPATKANAIFGAQGVKSSELIKREAEKVADKKKEFEAALATEKAKPANKDGFTVAGLKDKVRAENVLSVNKKLNELKDSLEKAEKTKTTDQKADIKVKADALKAALTLGVNSLTAKPNGKPLTAEIIDAVVAGKLDKVTGLVNGDFTSAVDPDSLDNVEKILNKLLEETNDSANNATANKITAVVSDLNTKTGAKLTPYLAAKDRFDDDMDKLRTASDNRAKAITELGKVSAKEGETLLALNDSVIANGFVQDMVTTDTPETLVEVAKDLHKTLNQATSSLNKGLNADIIVFNTGLSANTRLAKLSNPFNADLALAKAINSLKSDALADGGDALSSVVKDYTNRFTYDSNLWGNIFGGKGKFKNSVNPSIWGVTLGYDKAFDNTIVGGLLTYAQQDAKSSNVTQESNNYVLGAYARTYFGQNEVDAKLSYGFGKNDFTSNTVKLEENKGSYDSRFFNIDVDYGYIVDLDKAKFVKPIVGLSYAHAKNDGFTANGKVPMIFSDSTAKVLTAKLAAEFRLYTPSAGYFYITPGFDFELSKSVSDARVKFSPASKEVVFGADKKKNTYFTLKTGAEFKITDSLSTNINFGSKLNSKAKYYNGTLGLSYKF